MVLFRPESGQQFEEEIFAQHALFSWFLVANTFLKLLPKSYLNRIPAYPYTTYAVVYTAMVNRFLSIVLERERLAELQKLFTAFSRQHFGKLKFITLKRA